MNNGRLIQFLKNKLLNNREKLDEFKIDKNTHFQIFKYLYEMYKIDSNLILNGFNEINYIDDKGMPNKQDNPILMYDSNDKLVTWDNLYLGQIFNDDGCDFKYQDDLPNVSFMNENYAFLEKNNIDNINTFLKEIKIKPTFYLISLFPKLLTIQNSNNLTNWSVNLYVKGILKKNHFDILSECQFLSSNNTLIFAKELFISDSFYELKIQELFPDKYFISDSYHGNLESKYFKEFYKLCGIKDQFKLFSNINEIKTSFDKCNLKTSVGLFNLIIKLYFDLDIIKTYELSALNKFQFYTNDNCNRKVLSKLYLNSNYDSEKIPELEYFEDECIYDIDYLSVEYLKIEYSLEKVLSILDFGNIIKRKEIIPKLYTFFPKIKNYKKSLSIVKVSFN